MSRLWARVIRDHRIEKQDTRPCAWGEENEALTELCKEFDIPQPDLAPQAREGVRFLPAHGVQPGAFYRGSTIR